MSTPVEPREIAEACARLCDNRAATTQDPIRRAEAESCARAIRSGAWQLALGTIPDEDGR